MEDQVGQAISKNANGHEENNSDTDVEVAEIWIENQFGDINPAEDKDNGGDNNNPRKVALSCVDKDCNYQTPSCDTEEVACRMLMMHAEFKHKPQEDSGKTQGTHKIWLPEQLDLDQAEDNGEAFQFWLVHFESYLCECNITKIEEKFTKLKSPLAYSVFQHV